MITVIYPMAWLLSQLPDYVPAERLQELLTRLDTQKRAYARDVKINDLERRIRMARLRPSATQEAQIASATAKLERLRAEAAADAQGDTWGIKGDTL